MRAPLSPFRLLACRLGILALLLQALAPLILAIEARAAMRDSGLHSLELCTAEGVVTVNVPVSADRQDTDPGTPDPIAAHHQHCLACVVGHAGKLLAVAQIVPAEPASRHLPALIVEPRQPPAGFPAQAYQSRAPPIAS